MSYRNISYGARRAPYEIFLYDIYKIVIVTGAIESYRIILYMTLYMTLYKYSFIREGGAGGTVGSPA